MRVALVFLACVALGGCAAVGAATSQKSPEEISTVSERELCNYWASGPVVAAERARRGLGDCSAAHKQCVAVGYAPGTDSYLSCRAIAAQSDAVAAQQQATQSQALLAASAGYLNRPAINPPPQQRILPMQCRYVRVGNAVQQFCQ